MLQELQNSGISIDFWSKIRTLHEYFNKISIFLSCYLVDYSKIECQTYQDWIQLLFWDGPSLSGTDECVKLNSLCIDTASLRGRTDNDSLEFSNSFEFFNVFFSNCPKDNITC